ncbi:MAG: hypothetical protein EPO68_01710 [Planctomycetota bacterium]|nr:MAG: hypothetical protein EPO68_01710 [Planctomycetota bacterium]
MSASPREHGYSRRARASLFAQSLLLVVLAALVAALCVEVSRTEALRVRVDASRRRVNTLAEPTLERIRQLPSPARVDVFFRPEPGPQRELVAEVQRRALEFLRLAAARAEGKLELDVHDTSELEAVQARATELRVDDVANKVVVSLGERKAVLSFEEWAQFQPDPLDARRLAIATFKGEELLASTLARLSAMEQPRIAFSTGRGELARESGEPGGAGMLARALRDDGFELVDWDGTGPLPERTDIVALLAPTQPFEPDALAALRAHVERGGRLFAAASSVVVYTGKGSTSDLLTSYGLSVLEGPVCKETIDPVTGILADGDPRVAVLPVSGSQLDARHPITAPFVRHGRRVVFPGALALQRGQPPNGVALIELASSPRDSWRDTLIDPRTRARNFAYDGPDEPIGTFALLTAIEAHTRTEDPNARGRVVAVACTSALANATFETNRDLWLASFNWLARREHRVVVAGADPNVGRLDLARGPYLARVVQVGWFALPAACLLLALSIWFARRRP